MIYNDYYIQYKKLIYDNNVEHLFTKKNLNFNYNLIKESEINKNFDCLKEKTNYDFNYIKGCEQTHSNNVKIVDSKNINDKIENCDGLITNIKKVALITKNADCQSILLYDPINKVIGNIHSGWKGTLNTIILNAIDIMINEFNSQKSNILIFISPCIHSCCFEVDYDVMTLFKNKFENINNFISNEKNGKYFIDTIKLNKELLINYGLKESNIYDSNICTKCNCDIFHSYREDKENSGRNIALIYLK